MHEFDAKPRREQRQAKTKEQCSLCHRFGGVQGELTVEAGGRVVAQEKVIVCDDCLDRYRVIELARRARG